MAIDAFTCCNVTGDLRIDGPDITDLSNLDDLTSVGSYLILRDIGYGLSEPYDVVDAFPSLTSVQYGISMYQNHMWRSFDGFRALISTGDNIDFWYHDNIQSLTGFDSLTTCGWSLEIGGNPLLTTIPEFDSLTTIASSLFILDNAKLSAILGFNSLVHVDWSFQVNGNPMLVDFCGFYNYMNQGGHTGGGAFNIDNNAVAVTTKQDILDAGQCVVAGPSFVGDKCTSDADCGPHWCQNWGNPSTRVCIQCSDVDSSCKKDNECCSKNCSGKFCVA